MAALWRGIARSLAVAGEVQIMASLPGLCVSGLRSSRSLSSSASPFMVCRPLSAQVILSPDAGRQPSVILPRAGPYGKVASIEKDGEETLTSYRARPWESNLPSRRRTENYQGRTTERSAPPWKRGSQKYPESGSGMSQSGPANRRLGNVLIRNRGVQAAAAISNELLEVTEPLGDSLFASFRLAREFSSSALLEVDSISSESSDLDVEAYKREHDVTTSGKDVPDPFMTFDSTGFPPSLMKELHCAGFDSPSPIQALSWPIALQMRDVVAVSKTGSGKTLGYLLPAFLRLQKNRSTYRQSPTVLVLAPTRELANQIREEAVKFGRSSRIMTTCVSGGAPKGPQLRDIQRGVDIIVATPGRLNDLLEMGAVNLQQVSYLVLDEADRMLDMGFEPQIRAIVEQMPVKRQTLMYTATWPKEVRKIARDLMVDPVQVNVGNSDQLSANKSITQHVEIVSRSAKDRRLEQILQGQEEGAKVLIFCSTKRMCDELSMSLRRDFGALALHGDKSQRERDFVLQQFRKGKASILVATDVAARGLDVKDIRLVINYDFPTGVEDYVHRIGRTGRAGATGVAHTFFSNDDSKHARELIKVLESTNQVVPPELRQMGGGRGGDRRSGGGRNGPGSRWAGSAGGGNRRDGGYYTGRGSQNSGSGNKWGGQGAGRNERKVALW
ncbi:hypothetical protein R1sor_004227 [Riccia sorocarpa]|uniref:RNA helicase n=1 Tax=Riccia sorocarpa TaxID=122646 RepID=A0ABD3H3X5_9MARC